MQTNIIGKTRPETFDEVIGMEHNKRIIYYDIVGCQKLDQPMPSYCIGGPGGTGKSMLAKIIAKNNKRTNGDPGQVHEMLGSDIRDIEQLYTLAQDAEDGDVIFIEEAHTLGGMGRKGKLCEAVLLEWIENFNILNGGAYGLLQAPKTCFIFATTNPGKLSTPLRTRCKILNTTFYSVEQLEEILHKAGIKLNIDLASDEHALTLLAQSSRGTPRIGLLGRLDTLLKVMAVDDLPYCYDTVKFSLDVSGINEWGLDPSDIKYCEVLYQKMAEGNGRPVAKKTMESSMGISTDMLDNMVEAYLQQIHAIAITGRGRILTDFGCSLINKQAISEFSRKPIELVDEDELIKMLKDPAIRKKGMKGIMPHFGLSYPSDNVKFKQMLNQLGYDTVQKRGIIPLQKEGEKITPVIENPEN